jgi:hypothetical protein
LSATVLPLRDWTKTRLTAGSSALGLLL